MTSTNYLINVDKYNHQNKIKPVLPTLNELQQQRFTHDCTCDKTEPLWENSSIKGN